MKAKRILFGFGLLVTLGIMLGSCTKVDEKETIALIGKESNIPDIEEIFSENPVIKQSFDSVKRNIGIDYGGAIPPKIEGSYVVDPTVLLDSSEETMSAVDDSIFLRFTCQNNGMMTMSIKSSSIQQEVYPVFAKGNNDNFTAYCINNWEFSSPDQAYHVKIERGIIMWGSVTTEGLSDFRIAYIIKDARDDSNGVLHQYAPGTYMIYRDGNGLAEKFDW